MVLKRLQKWKDGENSLPQFNAASSMLAIFKALMTQSDGVQIGLIVQVVLDIIDNTNNWGKVDHCRWLIQTGVEWALYQHRYIVPTRLVERLSGTPGSISQSIRTTLTSIIIATFIPSTPLVHSSTSGVVSNLIGFIIHRAVVNQDDSLNPVLVECIGSLGTHVHSADQLRGLAEQLTNQLATIETRIEPGIRSGGRTQAIRSLLAGLCGLVQATGVRSTKHTDKADAPKTPDISTAVMDQENRAGRDHKWVHPPWRTTISPEVWRDTLTLLCDGDYAVRADYAQTLVSYINFGIPKVDDNTGPGGTKRGASATGILAKQAGATITSAHGNSVTGLLNALHAYVYFLATTPSLGIGTGAQNNDLPPSPHSRNLRRQRRRPGGRPQLKNLPAANLSDYGHILNILVAVHENFSIEALLTGIPMLLSLHNASQEYWWKEPWRYNAFQEVLAKVWLTVGKVWNCAPVIAETEKVCRPFPSPGRWQSDCSTLDFSNPSLFGPLSSLGYREAWGLTPSADGTGI